MGNWGIGRPCAPKNPGAVAVIPDVIPVSEPLRCLDERRDRLVVGDRGVPVVDEEARGRLEPDGPGA